MANHQSDTMSAHTYNLTPGQEDLLTAALNSNKPNDPQSNGTNGWVSTLDNGLDSILYPHVPGSAGTMNEYRMDFLKGPEDLDFSLDSIDAGADYDDDFDDQSPVNESAEPHEKRQRSDEDASKDDAGSKRQEGVEKVPKKPGRKPLTVEPTNVSESSSSPTHLLPFLAGLLVNRIDIKLYRALPPSASKLNLGSTHVTSSAGGCTAERHPCIYLCRYFSTHSFFHRHMLVWTCTDETNRSEKPRTEPRKGRSAKGKRSI